MQITRYAIILCLVACQPSRLSTRLSRSTTTSDKNAPKAGAFAASENISTTSFDLKWTAAKDDQSEPHELKYLLCQASSLELIDTMEECENSTLVLDWTAAKLSQTIANLNPGTTYYFNLVVKDSAGNKAVYAGISQKTKSTDGASEEEEETNTTLGLTELQTDDSALGDSRRHGPDERSFYDSLNKRHWMFYLHENKLQYSYSIDGTTWSDAQILATTALGRFAVHYKSMGGVSFVFLVAEEQSYDILLHRGNLSKTAIQWSSAETVLDGTSASDRYLRPAVMADDTSLWVAASKFDGFQYGVLAKNTTNAASSSTLAWTAGNKIGNLSANCQIISLLPLGGSDLMMVYQEGRALTSYKYQSGSWTSADPSSTQAMYQPVNYAPLNGLILQSEVLGSKIYAAGNFVYGDVGNPLSYNLTVWDGNNWRSVGSSQIGGNDLTYAIKAVGEDLYVGGGFTDLAGDSTIDYIARWDGQKWYSVGNGITGKVRAIETDSDGNLIVAGEFTDAGGIAAADYIAKLYANSWQPLQNGLNNNVVTLQNTSAGLYVGGLFTDAGGDPNGDYIAKWDGTTFSALGSGMNAQVSILKESSGTLYLGGLFTDAGGDTNADYVAKWNGTSFSAIGSGLNGSVTSLFVDGSRLFIGGNFTDAGGIGSADRITYWDGSSYQALSTSGPIGTPTNIFKYKGRIHISSYFYDSDNKLVGDLIWDGGTTLEYMNTIGANDSIYRVIGDGSTGYYVSGTFTNFAGLANADRIVHWTGSEWEAMGSGIGNGIAKIMTLYDGKLAVGGTFTDAGGNADCDGICLWNGSAWQSLGPSLGTPGVSALAASGTNLYVGGYSLGNPVPNTNYIARWNGSSWNALDQDVSSNVSSIVIDGANVYVGGGYSSINSDTNKANIAKWNGTAWQAMNAGVNSSVNAIAIHSGAIYIAGNFSDAGGDPNADYIAKWNGTNWESLSTTVLSAPVTSMDSIGSDLFIGGSARSVFLPSAPDCFTILKWTGTAFSCLGRGTINSVYNINNVNNKAFLASYSGMMVFDKAIADDVTQFDATVDALGNPVVIYETNNKAAQGKISTRTYTGGSWTAETNLVSSGGTQPSLTLSHQKLAANWHKSGAVEYKVFDGSSWSGSAATLISAGSLAKQVICEPIGSTSFTSCVGFYQDSIGTKRFRSHKWTP